MKGTLLRNLFIFLKNCFKWLVKDTVRSFFVILCTTPIMWRIFTTYDNKQEGAASNILGSDTYSILLEQIGLAIPFLLFPVWIITHLLLLCFKKEDKGYYFLSFAISITLYLVFSIYAGLIILTKEEFELLITIFGLPSLFLIPNLFKITLKNYPKK